MKQIQSFEDRKKEERNRRIKAIFAKRDISDKQRKTMQDFYGWLQRKGLKLESQRNYLQNLRLLFLDTKKDLKQLTKKDIDDYLQLISNKFKPKTQKERRMFLLLSMEWAYNLPKEKIDLIADIKVKPSSGTKLPEEMLSPEEVKKIIAVADNFRDQAMTCLLYETAARKGEFLQLKIKHIDLSNKKFGYVTIPMGKTDSRKLPIIYSLPYLIKWLNSHPNRDNPDAPLFVTQGAWLGRSFGEDGLKRNLKILGKRAGIKKKIYPHLFRHSRLTELAKELTEQELKKFAGWTAGSDMASVYVHLSGADVSDKLLSNAGLIDSKATTKRQETLLQVECPRCKKLNPATDKYCECGAVLDLKTAQEEIKKVSEQESQKDKRLEALEKQIQAIAFSLANGHDMAVLKEAEKIKIGRGK